ncbi:MAG: hypothetical protein RMK89_13215 [Armatimonadota bacterium]|nr:hypothetical protein [Armatimonadota bacterium]MDW8144408.1 hypothetical protein [Armatimonadota bacterium]
MRNEVPSRIHRGTRDTGTNHNAITLSLRGLPRTRMMHSLYATKFIDAQLAMLLALASGR